MWWRQRAQERCIETRFVFAMVDLEHERPSANKKSTQSNGTLQLYYPIYTQPSNSIVKFNIKHSQFLGVLHGFCENTALIET